MLRTGLIVVSAAAIVAGIVSLTTGLFPPLLVPAVWGVLILLGIVFERARYKAIEAVPVAGWTETSERFIDDDTGRPVTVYVEAATGERKYVAE